MNIEGIRAAYRQALGEFEPIAIRRYTGKGANRPWFDWLCTARVVDYTPDQLVGPIQQGDRKLIVLAQDLVDAQFPGPIVKNDKAVVRGKELNIEAVDDNTRRVGTVLIAYELRVRG